MAATTTNAWDEYVIAVTAADISVVDSWDIGLYDDSTDLIAATDTLYSAIGTEPSGNGYAQKTITPSTAPVGVVDDSSDFKHDVPDQTWSSLTFSSATSVDSWYLVIDVQLPSDTSTQAHLMAVGTLSGGPYDLQNYTDFTVQDIGVKQQQA